jgi:hypothetical protein
MAFHYRTGSKTHHTTTSCSRVPRNVKTNKEWKTRGSRPPGTKLCIECAAKTAPQTKKAVTKKKSAPKGKTKARAKARRGYC